MRAQRSGSHLKAVDYVGSLKPHIFVGLFSFLFLFLFSFLWLFFGDRRKNMW